MDSGVAGQRRVLLGICSVGWHHDHVPRSPSFDKESPSNFGVLSCVVSGILVDNCSPFRSARKWILASPAKEDYCSTKWIPASPAKEELVSVLYVKIIYNLSSILFYTDD